VFLRSKTHRLEALALAIFSDGPIDRPENRINGSTNAKQHGGYLAKAKPMCG
jgi:hypothetical protein